MGIGGNHASKRGMKEVNNKGMRINFKAVLLVFGLLFITISMSAQIGGNTTPLQYSVHEYSVAMDNVGYTPNWGVYAAGTTTTQIENGTATALIQGTDYSLASAVRISGGRTYFEIQFSTISNGPLATGNYVIGYKETTSDANLCVTALALNIQLYGPFDIDVALNDSGDASVCPDDSGDPKLPGATSSTTTIEYLVDVIYPGASESGYVSGLTWSFSFQVIVDGDGAGTNSTIASITATGTGMTNITWGAAAGSSNYTGTCTIDPSNVDPVTFTIVYNDVFAVNQDVTFRIFDIQGAYEEPDVDEVNGTAGNSLTHKIYNMPDVGDILAWN